MCWILMTVQGQVEGVLEEHARHFDEDFKDFNWGRNLRWARSQYPFRAHMSANVGVVPGTPYVVASTCTKNKCWGSLKQAPHKWANQKPKGEVPWWPLQQLCPSAVPFGNQNAHGVHGTWKDRECQHGAKQGTFANNGCDQSNERPIQVQKSLWQVVGACQVVATTTHKLPMWKANRKSPLPTSHVCGRDSAMTAWLPNS